MTWGVDRNKEKGTARKSGFNTIFEQLSDVNTTTLLMWHWVEGKLKDYLNTMDNVCPVEL